MRCRKRSLVTVLLSATVVLSVTCPPVAAQVSQRGYSSRGVNSFGSRGGAMGAVRPTYNRPTPVNPAGPLPSGNSYAPSGPTFDLGTYAPYMGAADMAAWNNSLLPGDISLLGTESLPGMRPSIRPRLDVEAPNVMSSNRVLKGIRDSVLKQIAESAERPFSAPWYAAHPSVSPPNVEGGNAWSRDDWATVKSWVGLNAEPQAYDFRPDATGLIFVYRNQRQLGRAVDARQPALQLARSPQSSDTESPGLSLGVFAEVPPVDQPVTSLLHLVVDKSGAISGYQYDFATDAVTPAHGAFDPVSQRVAWQVGDDVTEAGLENLTRDVTRGLLFRDDGWTQSWILMRVPASTLGEPGAATVKQGDAARPAEAPQEELHDLGAE